MFGTRDLDKMIRKAGCQVMLNTLGAPDLCSFACTRGSTIIGSSI